MTHELLNVLAGDSMATFSEQTGTILIQGEVYRPEQGTGVELADGGSHFRFSAICKGKTVSLNGHPDQQQECGTIEIVDGSTSYLMLNEDLEKLKTYLGI